MIEPSENEMAIAKEMFEGMKQCATNDDVIKSFAWVLAKLQNDADKIRYCYVARHLYKHLAWILEDQPEFHLTEWEKYEILRDTIDGLCMALSKMQDGTFDGLGDDDFKIQADVILENELEKQKRKVKK